MEEATIAQAPPSACPVVEPEAAMEGVVEQSESPKEIPAVSEAEAVTGVSEPSITKEVAVQSNPTEEASNNSTEQSNSTKDAASPTNTSNQSNPTTSTMPTGSPNPTANQSSDPSPSDLPAVSPERLQQEKLKYCVVMLKAIKKMRDASPFSLPVDPIALGIPDYSTIIKFPMDLSTIEQKLTSSQYATAEAFLDDVKLMLSNCFTYNPPETVVHKMGRSVERQVETLTKKMPTEESIARALVSPAGSAASAAAVDKKRKGSSIGGAAAVSQSKKRATSTSSLPPSASPSTAPPRRAAAVASSTAKNGLKGDELKNALSVWREVTKKVNLVWPFMQPVDPVALGIPDYFTVIREPMDFGTVKKRLDTGEYNNFGEFEREMRLVFFNCYTYNAPESDVVALGKQVEAIFEARLAKVRSSAASYTPSMGSNASLAAGGSFEGGAGSGGEESGEDSDSERMHSLKQQLATIKQQIAAINQKRRARKGLSAASGSASTSATFKPKGSKERKRPSAKTELTFEEKKQLSYDINFLAPEMLTEVVEIIRESIPTLRSSEEEIELDIDSLDVKTLRKLQAFVQKHQHQQQQVPKQGGGKAQPQPAALSESSDDSDSD